MRAGGLAGRQGSRPAAARPFVFFLLFGGWIVGLLDCVPSAPTTQPRELRRCSAPAQAVTAGKRVRTETSISAGSVSVSSAAAELALAKLPSRDFNDARVRGPGRLYNSPPMYNLLLVVRACMLYGLKQACCCIRMGKGRASGLA